MNIFSGFDAIIIGAGAAGLMCAANAGKRGRKILVIEHNEKVGKKILISGGGRCNFTNLLVHPENFVSENPHFCKSALSRFNEQDFISLVEKYKIPVYFHKNAMPKIGVEAGLARTVDDEDVIEMDGVKILVMHTPGHIDDAVCYYISGENSDDKIPKLITGDTLFVEACGRADLNGSNVEDLYKSLQRIKKLSDETEVYPGHDYGSIPISTIAHEKKHNRFLRCANVEEFRKIR